MARAVGVRAGWSGALLHLLFDLGPGVAEGDGAVEDEMARRAVGIDGEVAAALELVALARIRYPAHS